MILVQNFELLKESVNCRYISALQIYITDHVQGKNIIMLWRIFIMKTLYSFSGSMGKKEFKNDELWGKYD